MATDDTQPDHRPAVPGRLLYLTEPARAAVDFGMLAGVAPLLPLLPRGDGHPVLVLPGLGADDTATLVLRRLLRSLGYRVHGWGLGTNLGPTPAARAGMTARLDELAARYAAPISLIGSSLGGLYARRLARRSPESVRQVITLGTPVRLDDSVAGQSDISHDLSDFPQWPRWSDWARWYGDLQAGTPGGADPPPVPTTSIYSVLDGIVGWRVCRTDTGPQAENIAVAASHLGFSCNPAVVFAIADRLSQPVGDWHPFRAPPLLRTAYPRS
ncbi:alpha/beta fold hydrolase [[Mycobacterium] crassicus]|uniref:Alpha/beta hydrolase n=1 Tax=[Mycobacterium] crassicus TaxID=2872309 RepID=A0ABU5XM37_9MYCO|nr:alpha/beta hydrolase [Mycolicibacter sp. MYC098]MEB3023274.1 alpha/beta hydrolase [Mycolicibacter sp. MYC098]